MEVSRGANLVGMSVMSLDACPLSMLSKKKTKTSYALNFDDMTDKDKDKDNDGRASQTFAARFAQPYATENRKSEKEVSKEAK